MFSPWSLKIVKFDKTCDALLGLVAASITPWENTTKR
ncbi:TPA: hypothetical protein N0F65_007097 [Lagenidium giganteum]|uniref:Uncharacterized protein n=1 Tax=Lagenidium giganteum TaxID=4803 RepID=A0AAV2YH57_9STRA|nr:TPA: hypothetical protein N0F65_007097 [Lagenidium giganteum]